MVTLLAVVYTLVLLIAVPVAIKIARAAQRILNAI